MTRNADIIAHEAMKAIATTAATWTHSKAHWSLGRSFRRMAPRTAAAKTVKETSQGADTGAAPVMNI